MHASLEQPVSNRAFWYSLAAATAITLTVIVVSVWGHRG